MELSHFINSIITNCNEFDYKDMIVMFCNIPLWLCGMSIMKIRNLTKLDFKFTGEKSTSSIFHGSNEFEEWKFFLLGASKDKYIVMSNIRKYSFMISGIGVFIGSSCCCCTSLWPSQLLIEAENEHENDIGSECDEHENGIGSECDKHKNVTLTFKCTTRNFSVTKGMYVRYDDDTGQWSWNDRNASFVDIQEKIKEREREKQRFPVVDASNTEFDYEEILIDGIQQNQPYIDEATRKDMTTRKDKGDLPPWIYTYSLLSWCKAIQGTAAGRYLKLFSTSSKFSWSQHDEITINCNDIYTFTKASFYLAYWEKKEIVGDSPIQQYIKDIFKSNESISDSIGKKIGDNEKSTNTYIKLLEKLRDVYLEFGLFIVKLIDGEYTTELLILLILSTISLSLANGGKSSVNDKPGPLWWGPGPAVTLEKDGVMSGGSIADDSLRFNAPSLLSSILNLAVLKQSGVSGIGDLVVMATSQGYLCLFSFALASVIENTFRENEKPLGQLRGNKKPNEWSFAWFITKLCQILCMAIPIVVNSLVYFLPNQWMVLVVGIIVIYGSITGRFLIEPNALMRAWSRSTVKLLISTMVTLCSIVIFSLRMMTKYSTFAKVVSAAKKFYELYVKDYVHTFLEYTLFFSAVITVGIVFGLKLIPE